MGHADTAVERTKVSSWRCQIDVVAQPEANSPAESPAARNSRLSRTFDSGSTKPSSTTRCLDIEKLAG